MHTVLPLANGLRTDHPVPGLPFVDDSHMPIEDPEAFEAVGRNAGGGMWGRWDEERPGWRAFTTDPNRTSLAWAVRWHPKHGRTVLLVRDGDASDLHTEWHDGPLLFRSGGYWWDGATWFRPPQVFDWISEDYLRYPVKEATIVSAADLLGDSVAPEPGAVIKVADFKAGPPLRDWSGHLAAWARDREKRGAKLPFDSCVVGLSAPELTDGQLLGADAVASILGVDRDDFDFLLRGSEAPLAQKILSENEAAWSRPVAQDWAASRRHSGESAAAVVATQGDVAPGVAAARTAVREALKTCLLDGDLTAQHILRDAPVVAVEAMEDVLPMGDLRLVVRGAVLEDLGEQHASGEREFYHIDSWTARVLDWLIQQRPQRGPSLLAEIIRGAEKLGIPRKKIVSCLRKGMIHDGKLGQELVDAYLYRALPPGTFDR